ncbi:MAG: hypothetical protein R3C11_20535 [Planctomycetaceae bacterium]
MAEKIYVGTRKGLFLLNKNGSTWSIERHAFPGEPVSMLLKDPRDGYLYAALTHGHFGPKLHRSSDEEQPDRVWCTSLPGRVDA